MTVPNREDVYRGASRSASVMRYGLSDTAENLAAMTKANADTLNEFYTPIFEKLKDKGYTKIGNLIKNFAKVNMRIEGHKAGETIGTVLLLEAKQQQKKHPDAYVFHDTLWTIQEGAPATAGEFVKEVTVQQERPVFASAAEYLEKYPTTQQLVEQIKYRPAYIQAFHSADPKNPNYVSSSNRNFLKFLKQIGTDQPGREALAGILFKLDHPEEGVANVSEAAAKAQAQRSASSASSGAKAKAKASA